MRRKDRELMPEEAWEIVDRCADGVVSMVDDAGAPYAVPVNLVREDNRVYFHSAMAGKKADERIYSMGLYITGFCAS